VPTREANPARILEIDPPADEVGLTTLSDVENAA